MGFIENTKHFNSFVHACELSVPPLVFMYYRFLNLQSTNVYKSNCKCDVRRRWCHGAGSYPV